jgi:hypothetical protein
MAPDEFSATGDRARAITALEGLLDSLDRPPDDDADRAAEVRRLLAALETVRQLRDDLTRWEPQLIGAARELGASWAEIAPALGLASRQAAERRYLRLNPDASAPNLTGEQRVRAVRDRPAGDRAVVGWGPLAEVASLLAHSHPALAIQLNQVTADADQIRLMTQRTDPESS